MVKKWLPWAITVFVTVLWLLTSQAFFHEKKNRELTELTLVKLMRVVEKGDANVMIKGIDKPDDTEGLEDVFAAVSLLPSQRRQHAESTVAWLAAVTRAGLESVKNHTKALEAVRSAIDIEKLEEAERQKELKEPQAQEEPDSLLQKL